MFETGLLDVCYSYTRAYNKLDRNFVVRARGGREEEMKERELWQNKEQKRIMDSINGKLD